MADGILTGVILSGILGITIQPSIILGVLVVDFMADMHGGILGEELGSTHPMTMVVTTL